MCEPPLTPEKHKHENPIKDFNQDYEFVHARACQFENSPVSRNSERYDTSVEAQTTFHRYLIKL